MPANLSPEYMAAEARFREVKDDEDKLSCLQEMLRTIPKHKGTEKMQADIKRRISKLRQKLESGRGSKKKGITHRLHREGSGAVVLIGCPNVGKSQLLKSLTHAEPEIAPYPYTTLTESFAIMPYEDIQIELVDLPPVTVEHTEPWVFSIARAADGMLLLVDLQSSDAVEQFESTMELLKGANLDPIPPTETPDSGERVRQIRTFIVATKHEGRETRELLDLFRDLVTTDLPIIPVSAVEGDGLEELKRCIFSMLHILRVYSKRPGKPPDMTAPFTLPIGSTVSELAVAVHKEVGSAVKHARVWGGGRFDGQYVGRDYVLQEGDVVEIHI